MIVVTSLCKKAWVALIILFILSYNYATCQAQYKKLLSLEDAIAISLEKSYRMKTLRLSLVQAEENLHAAKGRFKTNADVRFDMPSWSESAVNVETSL